MGEGDKLGIWDICIYIYTYIYIHTTIYKIDKQQGLYSTGSYIQYLTITYNAK